jgi:hypothetical protein
MCYVGIDGCKVVEKSPAVLTAFVGFSTSFTRIQAAASGVAPGFAWGWKKVKPVGYLKKGLLYDQHFWYMDDYHFTLNHRSSVTGLLDKSYEQAINFAKSPLGQSRFGPPSMQTNPEGADITYVGCAGCYSDEL